jgi:hypothetical protein
MRTIHPTPTARQKEQLKERALVLVDLFLEAGWNVIPRRDFFWDDARQAYWFNVLHGEVGTILVAEDGIHVVGLAAKEVLRAAGLGAFISEKPR